MLLECARLVGKRTSTSMASVTLKIKCGQLLERRRTKATWWYYLRRDWRRQLAFATAYIAIVAATWALGMHLLSVGFAGYFIGRTIRDLRWWHVLSKEWLTTCELVDWSKVEDIAGQ